MPARPSTSETGPYRREPENTSRRIDPARPRSRTCWHSLPLTTDAFASHVARSKGVPSRPDAGKASNLRTERSTSALHSRDASVRSEEHTSALQSLMRISYAVSCLKTKNSQMIYKKHKQH